MDLAQNQHDHFFKALMERPRAAGALLRERLPPLVAEQIVGDPALVEGEFVDEEMRGSQSDRLYRVALRGGRLAYIYCLVEHKSAPDPRVALQLLRYLARIWERLDRDAGGEGPLAPILPLVVYHGKPEWSTPTRFSSMLAGADELKPYLLDFPFGLLDAGQVEDEELSREPELRAGLIVLKYAPRVSEKNVEEIVAWVLTCLRGASRELLVMATWYILGAYRPLKRERFVSEVRRIMSQRDESIVSEAAREWMAEGAAQGRLQGQAEALVRVLERRFGPLPSELLKRVREANAARLETWLDQAVDAATLDAALGEPTRH